MIEDTRDSPKFSTPCSLKTVIFVPFRFAEIVVNCAVCLGNVEEFIMLILEEKSLNGMLF